MIFSLHSHSHSSACFSLLPSPTFPSHRGPTLFYSFASDSHVHRFLHAGRSHSHTGRISGLLLNRIGSKPPRDEACQRIRIAAAIAVQRGGRGPDDAVEVRDNCGCPCWIHHRCYCFTLSSSPPSTTAEMGMRGKEEMVIGRERDITQPLSFSLHHSLLPSHSSVSVCFSLLASPPFPTKPPLPLFYRSISASDSPLHFSSSEHHHSARPAAVSSGHLVALCFLHSQSLTSHSQSGRVTGLLVNRHKLMGRNGSDDEVSERIRIGARTMAAAIPGGWEPDDALLEEATVALYLVLTNAVVEVQDNSLSDPIFFCWINECHRLNISSLPKSPPLPSGEREVLYLLCFVLVQFFSYCWLN